MAKRPAYWRILQASKREATLAVDLYNGSYERRSLEAFIVHMNIAWLYLLHAEFTRDHVDYRYRESARRLEYVDGEVKLWELSRCVRERWPANHPVRMNQELFIGLRNKIEHRFQDEISVVVAGHVQAFVLNYEQELVSKFGPKQSLADTLRFPVFLSSITEEGAGALKAIRARLPGRASRFLDGFMDQLEPEVADDPQFEFRVNLIPQVGPKTDADLAVKFVRLDELTENQRATMEDLGKTGTVLVRTRTQPVQNLGRFKPGAVVRRVRKEIPGFTMGAHTQMWKSLGVRPGKKTDHPENTDQRYCVWDEPHGDYLYTEAWVEKVIRTRKAQLTL